LRWRATTAAATTAATLTKKEGGVREGEDKVEVKVEEEEWDLDLEDFLHPRLS